MSHHVDPQKRREELLQRLGFAVSTRIGQDQVLWMIFTAFWTTHAVLLVALFAPSQAAWGHPNLAPAIVSGVGIVMSAAWWVIQNRALGHLRAQEVAMKNIEDELEDPPPLSSSMAYNLETASKWTKGWPRARKVMPLCAVIVLALWTALFVCVIVWRP